MDKVIDNPQTWALLERLAGYLIRRMGEWNIARDKVYVDQLQSRDGMVPGEFGFVLPEKPEREINTGTGIVSSFPNYPRFERTPALGGYFHAGSATKAPRWRQEFGAFIAGTLSKLGLGCVLEVQSAVCVILTTRFDNSTLGYITGNEAGLQKFWILNKAGALYDGLNPLPSALAYPTFHVICDNGCCGVKKHPEYSMRVVSSKEYADLKDKKLLASVFQIPCRTVKMQSGQKIGNVENISYDNRIPISFLRAYDDAYPTAIDKVLQNAVKMEDMSSN